MNDKNILVGLDVGTTKVCTIVGQTGNDGNIEIIGIGTHPSQGLKKGSVVNIEKTIKSIQCSLEEAKLMAGVNISRVSIGIAGSHIYSFNSSGVVAVKGREIVQEDVDRVIDAAKAIVIPSDREIIHCIPQEFTVDNTKGIKNPVGMFGVRLEANVHVVTGSISLIQNLVKCVEATGVKIENITLQPIASSEAVLSPEEREMGVVLVDIGGGTTDLAIWKDGNLIHTQIIPVGGNHFTNDLSVALKIPHAEAERVKVNHGSVIPEKFATNNNVLIQSGQGPKELSLKLVAEVLGARAEELFNIVKEVLDDKGLQHYLTGGIVLTGGGALVDGITELAEFVLERPTKLGYPHSYGGMTNIMQHPKFSTVLGLLLESQKKSPAIAADEHHSSTSGELIGKLSNSLKQVFKEIF